MARRTSPVGRRSARLFCARRSSADRQIWRGQRLSCVRGSTCLSRNWRHLCKHDRAPIRIRHDNESPPWRILSWPHNWQSSGRGVALTCIRIVDGEANGSSTDARACWEDPALVVAPVIAVEYDATRRATDHDDDAVLKQHGQTERATGVTCRRAQRAQICRSGVSRSLRRALLWALVGAAVECGSAARRFRVAS
jgi:hypothetical protein